jgi:hypothetical protein
VTPVLIKKYARRRWAAASWGGDVSGAFPSLLRFCAGHLDWDWLMSRPVPVKQPRIEIHAQGIAYTRGVAQEGV